MRVALLTSFAASKKEPLAETLDRIRGALKESGLSEPVIRFNFGDSPIAGYVSSVDRVLKRHRELDRFVTSQPPMPGIPGARRISNGPLSPAAGEALPWATLREIAAGVPRSFPFHQVAIHFRLAEFGDLPPTVLGTAEMLPGILVSDSWWVNGRIRSLSACTVVEGDPHSKKLPPVPAEIAKVFAACGKVKRTIQAPLATQLGTGPVPGVRLPTGMPVASANPEAAQAIRPVVLEYRARMQEIVERAGLPHDLLEPGESLLAGSIGAATGPKKPVLEQSFRPMGYTCRGDSGTFTLRRRTAANLTAELSLDVGTWSRRIVAMFKVWGLGFKATLLLPVTAKGVIGAQYPIGDAESWRKIVENLAALVAELDRTFVPAIEAAAGPSPEWYQPES